MAKKLIEKLKNKSTRKLQAPHITIDDSSEEEGFKVPRSSMKQSAVKSAFSKTNRFMTLKESKNFISGSRLIDTMNGNHASNTSTLMDTPIAKPLSRMINNNY